MTAPHTTVTRTPDSYQLTLDGAVVGNAFFTERPGVLVFTHTKIDPAHEGAHLGSTLVAAALDDVRARGERVLPRCPFVAAYIERHPAYADLVAP